MAHATSSLHDLAAARFQAMRQQQDNEPKKAEANDNNSIELPEAIQKLITGPEFWVKAKTNRYKKLLREGHVHDLLELAELAPHMATKADPSHWFAKVCSVKAWERTQDFLRKLRKLYSVAAQVLARLGAVAQGADRLQAETFVDAVARRMRVEGTLYALSLAARGEGAVGQMSTLIGNAFKVVADESRVGYRAGKPSKISVLLVDEGDALAQSRELAQMHHEDRAGVNALIKGIDILRRHNLPVLVVLCTNRLSALDPAVKRRAAYIVTLQRPNEVQRQALLSDLLEGVALNDNELNQLVALTGPVNGRDFGYTYSDLRQRLVPEAVILGVTYNIPLSYQILAKAIKRVPPTRPFAQEGK